MTGKMYAIFIREGALVETAENEMILTGIGQKGRRKLTRTLGTLLKTDFAKEDDVFEIYTEPDDLSAVRDALAEKGYEIQSADTDMVPSTYVTLSNEDDIKHMNLLLEYLEDHDDVQNVYHNWEMPDEE